MRSLPNRRALIACRRVIDFAAVATAVACASAPRSRPAPYQVGASVSMPPSFPPAPTAQPTLTQAGDVSGGPPSMAPLQPSIVGMPSTRVSVAATNEELPDVIQRVARQVGLSAIIDPTVRGPVTRSLKNVSLTDAMTSLVGNQFQYQVRGGTLVVEPITLVNHTYTVDYLAMSRFSTGSTVVSRGSQGANSLSNGGVIPGNNGLGVGVASTAGNLAASGADIIQSSSQADVWGELTQQLQSILFGTSTASVQKPGDAQGGIAGGPRSFDRCEERVCLRISPLTSLVDVTATPEKQEEVARYIGLFSGAIGRQVSIKAQVVEVSLDRSHNIGIDWNVVLNAAKVSGRISSSPGGFTTDPNSSVTSTGNAAFNLGFGNLTIQAVITALQSVGDVNVVATPSTNAMNQQKASFHVTREQQFFVITRTPIIAPVTGAPTNSFTETTSLQTTTTGLVFDVLPQISDKNVVMMSIRPSLTSLVSTQTIAGSNGTVQATLPVIDRRETDTMARVRSGETIMIGGLIQKQVSDTRTGIPILMDIPGLRFFFSHSVATERTSELVIFLTPEIISGQPPGGR